MDPRTQSDARDPAAAIAARGAARRPLASAPTPVAAVIGGTFGLVSTPGDTTFSVVLPASDDSSSPNTLGSSTLSRES